MTRHEDRGRMSAALLALLPLLTSACASAGGSPQSGPHPVTTAAADSISAVDGATRRVAGIALSPDPIVVERGDTVLVRAVLQDSAGAMVSGARWGVQSQPDLFGVRSNKASEADSYLLWGMAPGEGVLAVFLGLPGASPEQPDWTFVDSVRVRIEDWPVGRVVLAAPDPAVPYAGTALPLSAMALTTRETVHASAAIEWSTSDPGVAAVDDEGLVTFVAPGRATIVAQAQGVSAEWPVQVLPNPVSRLEVRASETRVRTGDVVRFAARAMDGGGQPVMGVRFDYDVRPLEGQRADGATVHSDGAFVAEEPGAWRVTVRAGVPSGTLDLHVAPRAVRREVSLVGHGPVGTATTDLWVFEGLDGRDYAYTGTMTAATMYAFDVTEPASPVMTDSVTVDGRRVNDVKVNDERTLAIVTSENASNRRNGITLLDITTPARPRIITHYTENLTGGVHNVWFDGDLVYAVHNGTLDVHIIDISDPERPREVGRWGLQKEDKYLHDVSVVDGLAYLSYWDDGLVILDVGDGRWGGTRTEPRLVSSIDYRYDIGGQIYGNTHHAIRYGDYVFLGDEIFGCPGCDDGPRGYVHVIDVSDIDNPVEVAEFRLPEAGTHNLWVEDDKLYIAYYQAGLRVVDVSGELRGDLLAQGREIAAYATRRIGPPATEPMAWGPQPYKGNIFVSDMNSGLWVVKLEPPVTIP